MSVSLPGASIMCTGFEAAVLGLSAIGTGSTIAAASRGGPPTLQKDKQPMTARKRRPGMAGASSKAADSSFSLLSPGQPTLLGS